MILVGELINSSRKRIAEAIESQDERTIQKIATEQAEAGPNYIDVNAGTFVEKEQGYLEWLVQKVPYVKKDWLPGFRLQ
jgi:cobalamin-dependent methionine synthase I